MNDAYEIAKQPGGKHHGLLAKIGDMGPRQRAKSVRSYREQIAEHLDKIENPAKYVSSWGALRDSHRRALLHGWRKEVADHIEQIAIFEGYENEHS